jgi:hypothetical protein
MPVYDMPWRSEVRLCLMGRVSSTHDVFLLDLACYLGYSVSI